MNKQDYELFADCRIRIYDDNIIAYDLYAEIENLGVSTPENPVKVRFIKPTENGLVYLDDASVKTIHPNWIKEGAYYCGKYIFDAEHDKKYYTGLTSLWNVVMDSPDVSRLPSKQLFELESICKAFQKCEFVGYNKKEKEFNFPQHCPKIREVVAFQRKMNAQLKKAAEHKKNKNTMTVESTKKIELEMER